VIAGVAQANVLAQNGSTGGAGIRPMRRTKAMKNVRPLHDRLLVRRIEEKGMAKGGIIIPDTAKEKPMQGKVLAVGDGKILEDGTKLALEVKVGDRILFGKYSGTEIEIGGEEVVIVREDEVLAVMG
jgi:chaperonin GroES